MTIILQKDCGHSQFTGYEGYCVCVYCGWTIQYETIKLDKNELSLENYIKKVLKQIDQKTLATLIDFDLGITAWGTVDESSKNRVKFSISR